MKRKREPLNDVATNLLIEELESELPSGMRICQILAERPPNLHRKTYHYIAEQLMRRNLPEVLDYIDGDPVMFEQAPMEGLATDNQLMAYKHESFWQCMDTLREKHILQTLWEGGNAPWKCWD